MTQNDRDSIAPANGGQPTTLEGALATIRNITEQHHRIYNYILENEGATDDELEVALDIPHRTVSARRRELVIKSLLKDSLDTRLTRKGRKAIVWVVGMNVTKLGREEPKVVAPDRTEIAEALGVLREVFSWSKKRGCEVNLRHPSLVKLGAWLNVLAGEGKKKVT